MIGGTLKTEITRAEALELALEGFLPMTPRGEKPKEEKRSLFRELGLPYVSDPAISRHHRGVSRIRRPDAGRHPLQRRLFYSGNPAGSAWRTCSRTGTASVRRFSKIATSISPSRAARRTTRTCVPRAPACWCEAVCRARTMSVSTDGSAVCLLPRGAEEGDSSRWIAEGLQLVANKPVAFRLLSSLTRSDDKAGDVVASQKAKKSISTRRSKP